MFPTLRLGDGFVKVSIGKRDAVLRLQRALVGFGMKIDTDGLFGNKTYQAVRRFQLAYELKVDGIVGKSTWHELKPYLRKGEKRYSTVVSNNHLNAFRGDLNWIHEREGHAGRPYWPGGMSGVTLDPGYDLGQRTSVSDLRKHYSDLSDRQINALITALGKKGTNAKFACKQSTIASIRISRETAQLVMPAVAEKYWNALVQRFEGLTNPETPPSIQTVMLSLGYNRGEHNEELDVLQACLSNQDWSGFSKEVGKMQQNHSLLGIRKRRSLEAEYIDMELNYSEMGESIPENEELMEKD